MDECRDVRERLLPGDTYTDKECPKCGALAYPEHAIGRAERERAQDDCTIKRKR
jgi:predicted RNA-binding Zn-ribbon protein involved in translation (DUF1610 family)